MQGDQVTLNNVNFRLTNKFLTRVFLECIYSVSRFVVEACHTFGKSVNILCFRTFEGIEQRYTLKTPWLKYSWLISLPIP